MTATSRDEVGELPRAFNEMARPLGEVDRLRLDLVAVALIAFSAASPDAWIAERNVDRWDETGQFDISYASKLSADAVPALSRLPLPLRERALEGIEGELAEPEPWASANRARRRARELLGIRTAASRGGSPRPRSGSAAGSRSAP